MIDSINLNIPNVRLNLKYMESIGIKYEKERDKTLNLYTGRYKMMDMITFSYKKVKFTYYKKGKNLALETTTHKILNKIDITLNDKDTFKMEINNIANEVLNTVGYKYLMQLTRIDYYVDLKLDDLKLIYLYLLKQHKDHYKYMKEKEKYLTSKYLRTKYGQFIFNFYDKEQDEKDKTDPSEYEGKYIGVLRMEIGLRKPKIKKELKKNEVERELDNYWNKASMDLYYFELLEDYLYKGDYCKIKEARYIIQNSSYSKNWQKKFWHFLLDVLHLGIDNLFVMYSRRTIKDYIEGLNILGINPITIDEEIEFDTLPNLCALLREEANKKYFK